MAWYNNWGNLRGDLGSILHGQNPANQPPPVNIPASGPNSDPYGFHKQSTGQTTLPNTSTNTPMATDSTQPVYPGTDTSDGSNGVWDWLSSHLGDLGSYFKDHAGDILKTGGQAAGGVLDYLAKQQALAQQKEQFGKLFGLQENNQGMTASSLLNRAPLADKGQYLALNQQAPTAFKPRDYTQGLNQIAPGQQAQGGAQAQLAANQQAAANYKPGAGGVDTATLKSILARLNLGQTPPTGNTMTPPTGFALPPTSWPTQGVPSMPTAQTPPTVPPQQPGQKPPLTLQDDRYNMYGQLRR